MSFATFLRAFAASCFTVSLALSAGAQNTLPPPAITAPAAKPALPAPPAWDTLRAAYDVDVKAPPTVREEARADADYLLQHLSFTNAKGQMVSGLFLRPKKDGVYPVALLLHGLGSDKETMIKFFGRPLAAQGYACLALDANLHGERRAAADAKANAFDIVFKDIARGGVLDYRQALTYLATRRDVDSPRIGLLGYSMGAMMGSILAGVDERVKASVLCVGGDPIRPALAIVPEKVKGQVEVSSPSNYIGHVAPRPVFFINGTQDTTIRPDAAKRLQEACGEPKTILWVETGHRIGEEAAKKGVAWLIEKLAAKK